jgi:hypothetical protein
MIKLNRTEMEFILALFLVLAFLIWVAKGLFESVNQPPDTKIVIAYDCRLAEISPDYPIIVKDKCRKLLQPAVRSYEK